MYKIIATQPNLSESDLPSPCISELSVGKIWGYALWKGRLGNTFSSLHLKYEFYPTLLFFFLELTKCMIAFLLKKTKAIFSGTSKC